MCEVRWPDCCLDHHIGSKIYVGGYNAVRSREWLREHKIAFVINASDVYTFCAFPCEQFWLNVNQDCQKTEEQNIRVSLPKLGIASVKIVLYGTI